MPAAVSSLGTEVHTHFLSTSLPAPQVKLVVYVHVKAKEWPRNSMLAQQIQLSLCNNIRTVLVPVYRGHAVGSVSVL